VYWTVASVAMLRTTAALVVVADADLDTSDPASVSIVVAARDEAATFAHAAEVVEAIEHPDLEIVLVDDRSSDGTGALMDELAAADERVQVVHVAELPDGWLGKVHALEQGRLRASGEWLLFTDADVELAPQLARRAAAFADEHRLDALALLPQVRSDGVLVAGVVGTFSRWLTVSTRLWHAADPERSESFGVGACNLVRRRALEAAGGLEWLRMDVADDAALARLVAARGGRTMLASGVGLVQVRWQDSVRGMTRGFEKYGGTGGVGSIPAAIALASLATLGEIAPWLAVVIGIASGASASFVAGAVTIIAAATVNLVAGDRAGAPRRGVWAGPISPLLVWWMQVRAAVLELRRGGVVWRDTFYSTEQLRAGKRYELPGLGPRR
jgi:GT2 family glycosyltransferase